jgi:hypothetical protein
LAQIEESAHACGVPPARYVREAALGRPLPQPVKRTPRPTDATRRGHEVVNQLGRVLNNLRQLLRAAELDDDNDAVKVLEYSIRLAEDAIARAPATLESNAAGLLETLAQAGVALNELARRANGTDELPPGQEFWPVLINVSFAIQGISP